MCVVLVPYKEAVMKMLFILVLLVGCGRAGDPQDSSPSGAADLTAQKGIEEQPEIARTVAVTAAPVPVTPPPTTETPVPEEAAPEEAATPVEMPVVEPKIDPKEPIYMDLTAMFGACDLKHVGFTISGKGVVATCGGISTEEPKWTAWNTKHLTIIDNHGLAEAPTQPTESQGES